MYKTFAFHHAEFSSYLRARMSGRKKELNDHWNRARNSVEHDSKSSNFNVVQTFITQVSDVYFDFYPEPFVLPDSDSEKYLQMRLRQIPINMFEDIFQQANFEVRPLMWHTYLYLTDTRHARVRNYYDIDEYGVPVDDDDAKKEIKKDTIKWDTANKEKMRSKVDEKNEIESDTSSSSSKRKESTEKKWEKYDYLEQADAAEEEEKAAPAEADVLQNAIGKYNDAIDLIFLIEKKMDDKDKVLFQEFVKDQKETATLETQRIKYRILPPVETEPSSFKKESKQHFAGTFLYNAVRGKFNYSFVDAFQGKYGIYDDMKKTDDVMWKFLSINNVSKSKIFSENTVKKYKDAVKKAWPTQDGTVNVRRCTIEDKGYATFPLAATLNNLSTLDIQNGDKDDFEYRAQFKRFLYLNNTFAYNTLHYIEKSSILLKVIMGYILGLGKDGDEEHGKKLIAECDARITFQDLIVERTSTKSALTISDEQKEEEKAEEQIKFKKISNTLWKCEDPKWPLQHLGAIDFHKLESIYKFEAKEDNFYDLYGTMFNEYDQIIETIKEKYGPTLSPRQDLQTFINKYKDAKDEGWSYIINQMAENKVLDVLYSLQTINLSPDYNSELEAIFRKILHVLFDNNIEEAKKIIRQLFTQSD